MKSPARISRRRFLKIVIFSSVALSVPVWNSCTNEVVETNLKESTQKLNLKIATIPKLTVKQDQNGLYKIPREYVYAPIKGQESVLVYTKKVDQDELKFMFIKVVKEDEKYVYTRDLKDNLQLLIHPQKTLNELNKIDHEALSNMFVEKYNVKSVRRGK